MPNQEIAKFLNINRKKVARLKNELIAYGLIEVKPSKRADKLYVNPPKQRNDNKLKKWDIANLKNGTLVILILVTLILVLLILMI